MAILGMGFSSTAMSAEVLELALRVSDGHQVEGIATLVSKRGSVVMKALEKHFNVPLFFYEVAELETVTARLKNPSKILFERIGCHGVAEAAALVAAGPQSVLVVEKTSLKNVTAALAE